MSEEERRGRPAPRNGPIWVSSIDRASSPPGSDGRVEDRLLRKEVIQPHLPVRLPCYDLAPVTDFTFGRALLTVRQRTSGTPSSHRLTGGVYKARERIHRGMLIRGY
jgi:hypothetical protein